MSFFTSLLNTGDATPMLPSALGGAPTLASVGIDKNLAQSCESETGWQSRAGGAVSRATRAMNNERAIRELEIEKAWLASPTSTTVH
jgi:hypothetical protein